MTATATKTRARKAPKLPPAMVTCRLVREATLTYVTGITSPDTAYKVLREVLDGLDREHFVCMHLSSKNAVLSIETVSIGTLNATLVHPREVFKGAILAGAAAIVVAHNHPSGDPTPSPEDRALTETLLAAGEILGIRVMDHIVIGDGRYVSLRETGNMWAGKPFHA